MGLGGARHQAYRASKRPAEGVAVEGKPSVRGRRPCAGLHRWMLPGHLPEPPRLRLAKLRPRNPDFGDLE